jgi:hypothetical protein
MIEWTARIGSRLRTEGQENPEGFVRNLLNCTWDQGRAAHGEAQLISRRMGVWVLVAFTIAVAAAAVLLPRIPQPQSYHNFADQRAWLGIPNFGDVASNLPFALGGAWGLVFLFQNSARERFLDPRERWAYVFVFLGLFLTAFGSAYYHLAPDNARLVWDRLPMTLAFMGLVSAMISERVDVPTGFYLLPVLLLIGTGSVVLWWYSEERGMGDLRFYAAVQVYAVLVLPVLLLLPPCYTRSWDFAAVFGFYVMAKIFETADHQIFSLDQHTISGHTLKHLAAGAAGFWILAMLQKRERIHRWRGYEPAR